MSLQEEARLEAAKVPGYIEKWQSVFFLQAWRIKHEFVERGQFCDEHNQLANVAWNLENRTATISLTKPEDLDKIFGEPWKDESTDYESVIVHELIHIFLAEMCVLFNHTVDRLAPGEAKILRDRFDLALEQTTEAMTRAFTGIERRDRQ